MTIDLVRNPLPAAERTSATLTVHNIGRDAVTWFHDGCAIPVRLFGEVVGAGWRLGHVQEGAAAKFKKRLVDNKIGKDVRIDFTPEEFVGKGRSSCADVGISDTIRAGDSIVRRALWDGMAYFELGVPPSGPVDLHGWAEFYFRGSMPDDIVSTRIVVDGQAWIVNGKNPAWLDPPEIVDVALTDAAFVRWLADKDLGNGMEEFIRFDPKARLWEVGVVEYGPLTKHYVRVDPATNKVVDTVDRPFVPEIEGNL